MKKSSSLLIIIPTVLYAVFFLFQVWFGDLDAEFFVKVTVTYAVYIVVTGLVIALKKDVDEEHKLRKDNHIN